MLAEIETDQGEHGDGGPGARWCCARCWCGGRTGAGGHAHRGDRGAERGTCSALMARPRLRPGAHGGPSAKRRPTPNRPRASRRPTPQAAAAEASARPLPPSSRRQRKPPPRRQWIRARRPRPRRASVSPTRSLCRRRRPPKRCGRVNGLTARADDGQQQKHPSAPCRGPGPGAASSSATSRLVSGAARGNRASGAGTGRAHHNARGDHPVSAMRRTIAKRLGRASSLPRTSRDGRSTWTPRGRARADPEAGGGQGLFQRPGGQASAPRRSPAFRSVNASWNGTHRNPRRSARGGGGGLAKANHAVVRTPTDKPILEIAREVKEMAGGPASASSSPRNNTGSTFTISNLGCTT